MDQHDRAEGIWARHFLCQHQHQQMESAAAARICGAQEQHLEHDAFFVSS
jgi:hypothetical protein